jgi:hypothetical protein
MQKQKSGKTEKSYHYGWRGGKYGEGDIHYSGKKRSRIEFGIDSRSHSERKGEKYRKQYQTHTPGKSGIESVYGTIRHICLYGFEKEIGEDG